jgi:uncharacterized protein (TIGR02266 family)
MTANIRALITLELKSSLALDPAFSTREQFDLIFADDGLQAWDLVRQQTPDLVFMDLHTAGLAGDECCLRIRQDPRLQNVPVVLVINGQHKEDLARCLKVKCTDIIFKPLSNHLLLATARRILGLAYRSFPRIATRLIVRFGRDSEHMHHGFSFNLSSGGMFLETEDPWPPDQELLLEFSLPNTDHPILCEAIVSWNNSTDQPVNASMPPGMGLQFLSLSLPDLLSIWEHISHLADSPAGPLLSASAPPSPSEPAE